MLRKILDAADARACLQGAEESGQTRAEWAHTHGVDGRSLHAWWLNLTRIRSAGGGPDEALRLVELLPHAQRQPRLVIRCGRLSVKVDERFDDEVLRRVLLVMASC